jgi:hypothetical protein
MKKFLYTIGFLMFSSALFNPLISGTALGQAGGTGAAGSTPATGNGAAAPPQASCTFPWTSCLHVNIPDVDFSATFGQSDPTKIGQNLYQDVMEMTTVSPDQKAFADTAGAYGTTQTDMSRLINNDFGPIMDKNPYLSQADAIAKMQEVQTRYQEEKEIYAMQSDIDAATATNEIFADGDTSNSGFDLIADLNNIENILFNKMDPIDIGGNYSPSSAGNTAAASGTTPASSSNTGPASAPNGGGSSARGGSAGTTAGASGGTGGGANSGGAGTMLAPANTGAGTPSSGLGQSPTVAQNPNLCFGNQQLNKALNDFLAKVSSDSRFKETSTVAPPASLSTGGTAQSGTSDAGSADAGTGTGTGTGNNGSGNGSNNSGGGLGAGITAPATAVVAAVAPAAASNWLTNPPCGDVLCLQINFVKIAATAYTDSDNCIACHVEKIDAKLKETINHSLIPGKATGNLLEPGICKQAAGTAFNSGIRFYAVSKPVQTPTNDDLIYGTSMASEWNKFLTAYKPFPFYSQNVPNPNDPTQNTAVPSIQDSATKAAITYSTDDTTISDLNNNIQKTVTGQNNAILKAAAVVQASVQTDTDASSFQAIQAELTQMDFYFDSFQNMIHRINSQVGDIVEDHACADLPNIAQCT